MPSETLLPDALVSSSGTTGNFSSVDEGVDAADGTSLTLNGGTSTARFSFPTPSLPPKSGTGLQTFRVRARRLTASPNLGVYLAETGGGTTLLSTVTLTSSFADYSVTWDAAALGTADGSAVEIHLAATAGGGVLLDALDWVVELSDDAQPVVKRIGGVPFMALNRGVW